MYNPSEQPRNRSNFEFTESTYISPRDVEDNTRQRALPKAKEFFAQNKTQMAEFKGLPQFPDEKLQLATATAEKLQAKFNEQEKTDPAKQWSTIQEAIILEQFELGNWFGESVKTIRPTDHADVVQGVDGVLKFNDTYLAFDASYKVQPKDKVNKIKEKNRDGELKLISYFADDEEGFRGTVRFTIIILGFDLKNLVKLTQEWLGSKEGIADSKKALAENPIQMLTIYQAIMQLSAFELDSQKNPDLVKHQRLFAKLKSKILEVYNQKIAAHPEFKELIDDKFTDQLIADTVADYGLKIEDVKNNVWPKKEVTGKVFKIPRKTSPDNTFRAAA